MPVQSAITYPLDGDIIEDNAEFITVKGYAYSGGGRAIKRVEVSVDGGKNWHTANLVKPITQPLNKAWAWTHWNLTIPMPVGANEIEVISKAVDISNNVQPEHTASIWNFRGLACNSWHRIKLQINGKT